MEPIGGGAGARVNQSASSIDRDSIRRLRWEQPTKAIVAEWRRLARVAGGRRTVVSCSGGADSVALLIALASAEPQDLVVCHVIHEMRAEAVARADAHFVETLAAQLKLPIVIREAGPPVGNAEAHGRNRRYEVLNEVAIENACSLVVTGHHADDQCETFLMAALRGSGPAGLAGIARCRSLSERVQLVRPMLSTTHSDAMRLCEAAGVVWREDRTNAQTDRLRVAMRNIVLPELQAVRPNAAEHIARAASMSGQAAAVVEDLAQEAMGGRWVWKRDELRLLRPIVLGAGLRSAALGLLGTHADALTASLLSQAVESILSTSTDPASFDWPAGLRLEVTSREVQMKARSSSGSQ